MDHFPPPSHASSCIPFESLWCICLLCNKLFYLCNHKTYICYYHYFTPGKFFTPASALQSLQGSRSILTDLNNIVIWRVLILPLISNFFRLLETIPIAWNTVGIMITLMFHGFFSFLASWKYLSLFLLFCIFNLGSARMVKFTWQQVLFFLVIYSFFLCIYLAYITMSLWKQLHTMLCLL